MSIPDFVQFFLFLCRSVYRLFLSSSFKGVICSTSGSSSLNVTASTHINFNVSPYSLTKINASGLNVFSWGRNTFPFSYPGCYNVSNRLDQLYYVMQDTSIAL